MIGKIFLFGYGIGVGVVEGDNILSSWSCDLGYFIVFVLGVFWLEFIWLVWERVFGVVVYRWWGGWEIDGSCEGIVVGEEVGEIGGFVYVDLEVVDIDIGVFGEE